MLKRLWFILGVFLPVTMSAQGYVWTGAAGNNDFFDESNWQDPVSEENPASGTIDPGVSMDLTLVIRDASQTVVANGDITMGAGSVSVAGASLSGITFSSGDLTINEDGYVWLNGSTPLGTNVKIDFRGSFGWVKLPEVLPADVLSSYESCFLLSGNAASYPDNIRIDNYYDGGALVRPNLFSLAPLIVYNETALQGNQSSISVDAVHSGSAIPGNLNNSIASFALKRGFMATLARNDDGTGISKVYIASEEDLVVEDLPLNLHENISFIRVVPWNWVSKKGIGGNVTGLDETWHYNWSNKGVSTIDRENTPMSWGKGGADDDSDIELYKSKYKTAHVLAFNESDNCEDQSGQYGDLCSTDVAVATYENLMKTGLRLVSPSGRENAPFGWLKEFYDKATAQDIRIDVIGVHWYDWGSNPKNSPNADPQQVFNRFKNYLQRVYELYQLPIWITEFNANINRTTSVNKAFMELALPYLESLDYVERYAWFEPFSDVADYYDGNGNYTDVGL
ncbi:MAG: glycosyl hydrolase, partial [Bacteroidota bacterium]